MLFNVRGVAITSIVPFPADSTASFTAGSIPITGKGCLFLISPIAALVAVLQATTIDLVPCVKRNSAAFRESSLTVVSGLVPYGACSVSA